MAATAGECVFEENAYQNKLQPEDAPESSPGTTEVTEASKGMLKLLALGTEPTQSSQDESDRGAFARLYVLRNK